MEKDWKVEPKDQKIALILSEVKSAPKIGNQNISA